MAALQASTSEPAAYLGTSTGRIAPNHKADLAILDANPLHDIKNTQRLSGIVVGGRYLNEQARQQLLAEIAETAANTPTTAKMGACPCHTG